MIECHLSASKSPWRDYVIHELKIAKRRKTKVNLVNSVALSQVASSYSKRQQRCKTMRTLASTFFAPKRIPHMTVLSVNGLTHAPAYALHIFHLTLKD